MSDLRFRGISSRSCQGGIMTQEKLLEVLRRLGADRPEKAMTEKDLELEYGLGFNSIYNNLRRLCKSGIILSSDSSPKKYWLNNGGIRI